MVGQGPRDCFLRKSVGKMAVEGGRVQGTFGMRRLSVHVESFGGVESLSDWISNSSV